MATNEDGPSKAASQGSVMSAGEKARLSLEAPLLDNVGAGQFPKKTKGSLARTTVATSDARLAKAALEFRNKRASVMKAESRQQRASVATSDARLLEGRRDEEMAKEFLAMAANNKCVEDGMAKSMAPVLKKVGRRISVMAGYDVDEEDEEDPDEEGEGCSNTEGILNMLNNALGTGMLALASVMMKVGLIIGIGTMIFSACLNCFTMMTHVNSCRLAKCDPAGATLGEIAVGRAGFYTTTVSMVILCFFCMVSYVVAASDAMKAILALVWPGVNEMNDSLFILINWAVCLVPGTFLRTLGGVAVMSLISFIGALLVLMTVMVRCFGGIVTGGFPPMDQINILPESPSALLGAAPVLILCYSLQAGGGIIIGGLKDNSRSNQTKICVVSYIFVFCLEIVVACSAYLFFLDKTPADVMNAFPNTDPIANIGRLGVLCLVLCGYVMMNVPARVMIIQLVYDKNESQQEASYPQFLSVNLGISVGALLVGLSGLDLTVVLGISGALATPLIAFLCPAVFTIFVRAKADENDEGFAPVMSMKQLDMYVVFVLGMIFLVIFNFNLFLGLSGYKVSDTWGIVKK